METSTGVWFPGGGVSSKGCGIFKRWRLPAGRGSLGVSPEVVVQPNLFSCLFFC